MVKRQMANTSKKVNRYVIVESIDGWLDGWMDGWTDGQRGKATLNRCFMKTRSYRMATFLSWLDDVLAI